MPPHRNFPSAASMGGIKFLLLKPVSRTSNTVVYNPYTKATFRADSEIQLASDTPSCLMRSICVFVRCAFVLSELALMLLWAAPGFATLGQDVSSVRDDQAHLNASETVFTSQLYSVH